MKKSLSILSILTFIAINVSCEKFLTKEPIADLGAETYFTDEKSLELYANGFIERMLPDASDIIFGNDSYTDLIATRNSTGYFTTTWTSSSQTGWSYSNWYDLFNINYFLVHINDVQDITDEVRNNYIGIARFWRALFYYEKVKTFGDVPWYDEPIDANDDENLYKARDDREYVMQKVLEDLNFASENCSANAEYTQSAQADKWTALALKSRICLFEGTYRKYHSVNPSTGQPWKNDESEMYLKECVNACEEIMQNGPYSLVNSTSGVKTQYRSLFINEALNRQEVIWGREYSEALGKYHTGTWDLTSPTKSRWSMTRAMANMYLMLDGSRFTDKEGWEKMTFAQETADRDYRMMQTIITPGYQKEVAGTMTSTAPDMSVSLTGYYLIKWCFDDDRHTGTNSNNSVPIIRYAEVLLNYAEAKAELNGGILEAADWDKTIKLLRERAGVVGTQPILVDSYLADYYGITSKDLLEIRRERAVELFQEDLRYDDLMRWHKGELVASEWQGIYIPEKEVSLDLNEDGKNDLCITDGQAGNESGVYYISLSDGSYTLTGTDEGILEYHCERKWEDKMYLRPIPRTANGVNPALGQNYGWEN